MITNTFLNGPYFLSSHTQSFKQKSIFWWLCNTALYSKSEVKLTMNSYLPNHTVSSAQSRVNFGTHTNESSWNGKHHFILFSKQGDNSRSDWLACQFAIAILGNKSRSHFDLLANFKDTLENRSSGHTSFKIFYLTTRFVDIERPKVKIIISLEKSEGWNPRLNLWTTKNSRINCYVFLNEKKKSFSTF